MPTRKISDRERWTRWAREAGDEELDSALEILRIERSVRGTPKQARKVSSKKPAGPKAVPSTTAAGEPDNG